MLFGIFEKRVTLTIYRVIDYFRGLKTCGDPEFFSKGEGWSPRHIFGNLIRKILRKIFRGGGVFPDAPDPL